MALFAVIIDDKEGYEKVIENLNNCYPDNYVYHGNDRVVFVRTDDISEKIAHNIGIKGDKKYEDASGAVYKLNGARAGYTNGAIWEWLSKYD